MSNRIPLQTIEPVVLVKNTQGISKKTNNPYHFVSIANKKTYENIQLSVDVERKIVDFSEGEIVHLVLGLTSYMNNPSIIIEDILPATD